MQDIYDDINALELPAQVNDAALSLVGEFISAVAEGGWELLARLHFVSQAQKYAVFFDWLALQEAAADTSISEADTDSANTIAIAQARKSLIANIKSLVQNQQQSMQNKEIRK